MFDLIFVKYEHDLAVLALRIHSVSVIKSVISVEQLAYQLETQSACVSLLSVGSRSCGRSSAVWLIVKQFRPVAVVDNLRR